MMPTKNQFWENEVGKNGAKAGTFERKAFVTGLTPDGRPIIKFTGETIPSKKIYIHVKNYTPEVGDMVMLIGDVIIGGWRSVE